MQTHEVKSGKLGKKAIASEASSQVLFKDTFMLAFKLLQKKIVFQPQIRQGGTLGEFRSYRMHIHTMGEYSTYMVV